MTQPRLLGGRYELDGIVGRGGMAEVFRARDIRLDRIVGVKTLRDDLARDQTFQARFRREAQSAASLNHPSIVAVYDTGEDMMGQTPVPYIVMEFVDGRTLRDLLRDDRRLLPERAAEITDGVLRALDYSHRHGIVHRDIKPGNVMLTRDGQVKVMDFGIARAVSDAQATMTQTAQVIGTAQYLSPEQARGERVDARSDLYSAGCLLYELLVGRPPFTGDSPVAIAYQHVREDPVPPSRIDPEVPDWADAIVLKAMMKDPADRYQSAGDMRNDLQRALSGAPVAAPMMHPDMYAAGTRRMGASTQMAGAHQRDPALLLRARGRRRRLRRPEPAQGLAVGAGRGDRPAADRRRRLRVQVRLQQRRQHLRARRRQPAALPGPQGNREGGPGGRARPAPDLAVGEGRERHLDQSDQRHDRRLARVHQPAGVQRPGHGIGAVGAERAAKRRGGYAAQGQAAGQGAPRNCPAARPTWC